ncbi:MAG TPA: biotin/lipoyl-containing protein, partial [Candidatus Thermoplasmatota archaeon]|nr:biotin/lipoyl-containing protein [Candidatus Thermoplasmatota archaeon]
MAFQFKLPDIGEGIQEGEIVRWMKKEGEAVSEDEPVVEVMTDKATVELTSPRRGTIAKLHFKEGDVARVGQVILEINESTTPAGPAAASASPAAKPAAHAAAKGEAHEEKTLFELPKEVAAATKRIARRDAGGAPSAPPAAQAPQSPAPARP